MSGNSAQNIKSKHLLWNRLDDFLKTCIYYFFIGKYARCKQSSCKAQLQDLDFRRVSARSAKHSPFCTLPKWRCLYQIWVEQHCRSRETIYLHCTHTERECNFQCNQTNQTVHGELCTTISCFRLCTMWNGYPKCANYFQPSATLERFISLKGLQKKIMLIYRKINLHFITIANFSTNSTTPSPVCFYEHFHRTMARFPPKNRYRMFFVSYETS